MTERWILNASPLIALGRIGYTHLFNELATDIAIPRAVADEIKAGPANDRAYRAVTDNAHYIVDTSLAPEVLKRLPSWSHWVLKRSLRNSTNATVWERSHLAGWLRNWA